MSHEDKPHLHPDAVLAGRRIHDAPLHEEEADHGIEFWAEYGRIFWACNGHTDEFYKQIEMLMHRQNGR